MALTCGFYNSVDGDRKYDATQFASLFDGVITDGVVAAVGDFFATTPGGGMVVNVGTGRAWFNRTWTYSDAKIPLTLDASDLLYDRIDAVVLEIDTSIAIRDNSIKVVKGTPAQEPQKPALTNEGDVHQYALAYVRVKASSIEVGAGDITINVGQADCPFVTSIVETPELEVLFARWEAEFTEWFENIQSQLEGDIAANLQRQIDLKADKADVGDFETPATKLGVTGELTVSSSLDVLANVGDLHVWRKTETLSEKVPAKYTLGFERRLTVATTANTSRTLTVYYGNSDNVHVSDDGTISMASEIQSNIAMDGSNLSFANANLKNIFCRFNSTRPDEVSFPSGFYFLPENTVWSKNGSSLEVTKARKLTGVPAIPSGTQISYPVSVNKNAYTEGSDGKPAGYTLGEEKNGQFKLVGTGESYEIASSIYVDDSGNIKLVSSSTKSFEYNDSEIINSNYKNKFWRNISYSESGDRTPDPEFTSKKVFFIPSSSVASQDSRKGILYISKYQNVNGYPAISAGSLIEYLGKLGDNKRIVSGIYLGTGVNPSPGGVPVTLNLDGDPAFIIIIPTTYTAYGFLLPGYGMSQRGGNGYNLTCTLGKTTKWYTSSGAEAGLNAKSTRYRYMAFLK